MPRKIRSKVVQKVLLLDENKTALDAAVLMTDKYVGSVVVTGERGVRGIFTERDLMMRVVGEKLDPSKVQLKDVVSAEFVKISPDETCGRCLDLMKNKRCRHLLVFDGDAFYGILSLRDLISLMIGEKEELISYLEKYISGSY